MSENPVIPGVDTIVDANAPGRTGQIVSAETRARLLDAARKVYAEQGYHLTTVEQILKEASVSRPTFYKAYENKQQILQDVIQEAMLSLHVQPACAEPPPVMGSYRDALVVSTDRFIAWGLRLGTLAARLYREVGDPVSPVNQFRGVLIARAVANFQDLLRRFGHPPSDPLLLEAFVYAQDHIGADLFSKADAATPADVARAHDLMLRVCLDASGAPRT